MDRETKYFNQKFDSKYQPNAFIHCLINKSKKSLFIVLFLLLFSGSFITDKKFTQEIDKTSHTAEFKTKYNSGPTLLAKIIKAIKPSSFF